MERARNNQISIEQLNTELAAERGTAQKMENSKMMMERQNKELKVKLEEVENSNRTKAKAAIADIESKVSNMEEQLSAEAQERMLAAKANRKLEKKIKKLLMQLEDESRHADQYKEQTYCRGLLARRNYQNRVQQMNVIRILQRNCDTYLKLRNCVAYLKLRNCAAYLKLRNCVAYIKLRNCAAYLKLRNCAAYLKLRNWQRWRLYIKVRPLLQVTKNDEKVLQKKTELQEITEKLQKHEQEVDGLDKQYQQALERKQEMEETIHDMEVRIEEEEEEVIKSGDDKKKLQ